MSEEKKLIKISNSDFNFDIEKRKIIYFECDVCKNKFISKRALITHIRRHSRPGLRKKTVISCVFCDYKTTSDNRLGKHLTAAHGGIGIVPCFTCIVEPCGPNYSKRQKPLQSNNQNIKTRKDLFHNYEEVFAYSSCDYSFDTKYSSQEVPQKRTRTSERPYACSECDKQYNSKFCAVEHLKTHTGEQPYACSVCDKRFTYKSNLRRHLKNHTHEKPCPCTVCDKRFSSKYHLRIHMYSHTGEKPHACTVCDKRFTTKVNLVTHLKIHSGVKPFVCCVCNKGYSSKFNLRTHMVTHTGEKPYACHVCNMKFSYRFDEVKHARTHLVT